jgi:hypothetical protein
MSSGDLDNLLSHLRRKLSPFVGKSETPWQVEIHGKGSSIQVRLTEVTHLVECRGPLEERR